MNEKLYDTVKDIGKCAGKKEYLKYLEDGFISIGKAVKAMCFTCMCYYIDGRDDCRLKDCPLYPFMPYRDKSIYKPKPRSCRKISEEQKQKMRAGRKKKCQSPQN